MNFLAGRANPFTGRPYELGERSLYRYISGEMQFPVDLLPALVSWSLDERLMAAYNIFPAPSDRERMAAKIAEETAEIRAATDRVRIMKSRLAEMKK
jgi:hypothetical protein